MKSRRKSHKAQNRRASRVPRAAKPAVDAMEEARFIQIDLDVRSRRSVAPLLAAWPSAYQPIQGNPYWLILNPGDGKTAEATARLLLDYVAALSPIARRCWNRASKRTFDIGVQAGIGPRAFEKVQLTPDALSRIGSVGGRLQVTVYPPHRASD